MEIWYCMGPEVINTLQNMLSCSQFQVWLAKLSMILSNVTSMIVKILLFSKSVSKPCCLSTACESRALTRFTDIYLRSVCKPFLARTEMFLEHTGQHLIWDMKGQQLEGHCTANMWDPGSRIKDNNRLDPSDRNAFCYFFQGKILLQDPESPKKSFSEASYKLLTVAILKYAEKAKPEEEESWWYPLLITTPDFQEQHCS